MTLSNANSAQASFVAEVSTDTRDVHVTVDDGTAQASDEVTVTILASDPVDTFPYAARGPVADVMGAQAAGTTVTLDATQADADGDTAPIWTQT